MKPFLWFLRSVFLSLRMFLSCGGHGDAFFRSSFGICSGVLKVFFFRFSFGCRSWWRFFRINSRSFLGSFSLSRCFFTFSSRVFCFGCPSASPRWRRAFLEAVLQAFLKELPEVLLASTLPISPPGVCVDSS